MGSEDKLIKFLTEYVSRKDRREKAFKEEMAVFRRGFNQSNSRKEALMKEHYILRQDFSQSNFRQEMLSGQLLHADRQHRTPVHGAATFATFR